MARAAVAMFVLVAVTASAAAAKSGKPRTVQAHGGSTRAVLVYFPYPDDYGRPRPRLSILRHGRIRLVEVARPHPRARSGKRVIPFRLRSGIESKPLAVRDLDHDGEPEVLLDLFWGGTRCCLWTRIYRYDRLARRYVGRSHFWGNFQDNYRLRDLDHDRRPEFVSADGRIARVISSYHYASPIQIWVYRRGRLEDMTRRFPGVVASDARKWWAVYLRERQVRRGWVRQPLAAWVADQYLLGRARRADRMLAAALRRGDLRGGAFDPPARAYVMQLKRFLQQNGYAV